MSLVINNFFRAGIPQPLLKQITPKQLKIMVVALTAIILLAIELTTSVCRIQARKIDMVKIKATFRNLWKSFESACAWMMHNLSHAMNKMSSRAPSQKPAPPPIQTKSEPPPIQKAEVLSDESEEEESEEEIEENSKPNIPVVEPDRQMTPPTTPFLPRTPKPAILAVQLKLKDQTGRGLGSPKPKEPENSDEPIKPLDHTPHKNRPKKPRK